MSAFPEIELQTHHGWVAGEAVRARAAQEMIMSVEVLVWPWQPCPRPKAPPQADLGILQAPAHPTSTLIYQGQVTAVSIFGGRETILISNN